MDKVLSFLGIAMNAGKVSSGGFNTEKLIKSHKAQLVIVSGDASENTKKLFFNKCNFYKVPIKVYSSADNLGKAIGKSPRSSLAISDKNFALNIKKMIEKEKV